MRWGRGLQIEAEGAGRRHDGQFGIEMNSWNALDEIGEILELQRFYEEGMGAEFVGAIHDFDVRSPVRTIMPRG